MGNHTNTNQTNLKYLKGTRVLSPSSSTLKGVQLITFVMVGLLTSFGISILSSLAFGGFFSNSAYAAFSASISRSGTINLAESSSDSIRPTSSGTLGTGSDTVSVTTNCTYGGYNLYVSATSTGGTNLNLSGASASELTNSANYIATSSTATGSETTLSRDTWGVGKTASAFSGLPAYAADISSITPFYTGTTSASYDFYYGVNVSTAKTPGTYTGEVLYTVLMDSACTSYTLNFSDNSATTNTLTSQDLAFDSTLDLAAISDSTKIARTGYTLTGWKDQNNNSYGITGTVDVNPDDLSSVTLTALWTANTYTIAYNGNGSTSGSTISQTSQAYTSNVTLQASGFTKTGYNFLGWSLDSSATTASYSASTAYAVSTIVNAANQANNNGATITLYAVWRQSVTYMQDWSYADCAKLNTNEYLTLRDSRDDNDYVVKKLADGKCWMAENLRLVGSRTLTSSDSNVSSDFALTASTAPTWCTTNSSDCDDQSLVYYVPSEASDSSKPSYYGALYNWYAATAGTGKYATSSGNASSSICPKGWRLPVGGSSISTNEFSILDKAWGGTGANRSSANTYSTFTGAYTSGNNGGFGLAGWINGTLGRIGTYGYYWSSTALSSDYTYRLSLVSNDAGIYPQDYNYGKYVGRSVRCVAEDTMQETSAANLAESTTTSLSDSRDNQSYTVYRWPSTGTAGTDYPTGMAGYAIMTKDLSLGYVTGGSITKGSNLTLTTSDSAAAGTITARTGTGNWSTTNSDSNLQYINGTGGTYDSHSYYSYGAAQKVCPKGWRPPTQTEYDNIATFMGGNNSTGSSKIRGTPYNFVYGGRFSSSGWNYVGSSVYYWASTQYSSTYGYYLYFNSSSLRTGSDGDKYIGRSVRCISD